MPSKSFNILGTSNLIDRMKIECLHRSKSYPSQWDIWIDKSIDCFNTILDLASTKNRNYILDQTNVFPTSRDIKIKAFQGMRCKAIVVVPSDNEFNRRCASRTFDFGQEIPESLVDNMKANFVLPEYEEVKSNIFSEVHYVELDHLSARQLVQKYNVEASGKGYNMTPLVRQFVARNSHLKAGANDTELIRKCLPINLQCANNSIQTQIQDPGELPAINLNKTLSDGIENSKIVKEQCNEHNSTINIFDSNDCVKDTSRCGANFRSQILSNDRNNVRDRPGRYENYNRTCNVESRDNYNKRGRRSRSREANRRSRSRSWDRKRRLSRRSRSRSRDTRYRRNRRSRDRSKSRHRRRSRERRSRERSRNSDKIYDNVNDIPCSSKNQGMLHCF